ncbi:MAG: class I SAM-dependent methyltransferase [Proteobacteria bacterium]|nr:class I SAM-dependent methyltransferase [Pseudomonadota bacterium]
MSAFTKHEMLADATHDERARQSFVKSFRGHLSGKVMPGTYQVYAKRVVPAFEAKHGRAPKDERELRPAMTQDSYYQFWSAMQRRSQEMLWESVIDPAERQLPQLIERSKQLAQRKLRQGKRGSLRLNPDVTLPRYHAAADIHLQPGGYHTDFTADDVAAGVVYDKGINLYMGGALGPENNAMGDLLVTFFREKYADRKPQRILDMGCAIGNSTLVWARAFPAAEVHGIDVGAPVLRYAHARAQSMGVPVHFTQANAESTGFPAGGFDLIISHIMLHETSKSAIVNVMRESLRLLAPGGLMLHLEIPRGDNLMEQFMHNWESYNNNETFARYMTGLDLKAVAVQGGFDPVKTYVDHFSPGYDVEKTNYSESFIWKILVGEK